MVDCCVRCYVSGRVQGVYFRGSTRERARALGLDGYVRNLADGRVEVVACGESDAVERLRQWLHDGPPLAVVEAVVAEAAENPGVTGFEVR